MTSSLKKSGPAMSNPDYASAVGAPDAQAALQKLNALLALDDQIVGVEDHLNPKTCRKSGAWRWVLTLQMPSGETWRAPINSSAYVRDLAWLRRWARYWGRSASLPVLTSVNARTALRLMHEIVEANEAHDAISNTSTNTNIEDN
jgi:hypothetical protein